MPAPAPAAERNDSAVAAAVQQAMEEVLDLWREGRRAQAAQLAENSRHLSVRRMVELVLSRAPDEGVEATFLELRHGVVEGIALMDDAVEAKLRRHLEPRLLGVEGRIGFDCVQPLEWMNFMVSSAIQFSES